MSRLILVGAFWLLAIAMVTTAAFLYFNRAQYLNHKREQSEMDRIFGDDE